MNTKESTKIVDVLIGSPRQEFWDILQILLKGYYPYKMHWVKSVEEIMDSPDAHFNPILALIDGQDGTAAASEWSQAAKMTYNACPIIVLHAGASDMNFEQVKKNGATEIMHLTFDREFISDMVLQLAPIEMQGDQIPVTSLMPVDLRDLEVGSETNFEIFVHLPSNQKTILYRKSGATIDQHALDKFSNSHHHMYIKKTQMKDFFEYSRTMLSRRNIAVPVSMTEKFQKSKKSIFTIMANFMNTASSDFQEGRKILSECIEIINSFELTKDLTPAEIYTEIARFTGNTRAYYHDAIHIAAYSAFFVQLVDMPAEQRQNAALAGLLHNIGLAQLPLSATEKSIEQMTPEEKKSYLHCPERSVTMVKSKRVSLPLEVLLAIEQHRELGDGSGFPQNLAGSDIQSLSKILILAFKFHVLTPLENGLPSQTPKNALKLLQEDVVLGGGHFDIIFTNQIFNKIGK